MLTTERTPTAQPAPTRLTKPLNDQRRHFDSLFTADDDPWSYRTRFSEQRRHALVLAMLDKPRYAAAFEPGCANGVLTSQLAPRCDWLQACDASTPAVALAAKANDRFVNVSVTQRLLPTDWPTATHFDLVVLVDFLYYLDPDDVALVAELAWGSLAPQGTLLVAHWRGEADDFRTPTEAVHRIVRGSFGTPPDSRLEDREHLIDLWVQS